MRVETRPVYIADNGREFDDEKTCVEYEIEHSITEYLMNHSNIDWRDTCAQEVVSALREKYDITLKP